MKRSLGVVLALCVASPAFAERPRDVMIPVDVTEPAPRTPEGLVPYNTIFLNNCKPNGCRVTHGNSNDSRSDTSTIAGGTLRPFSGTDQQWKDVVACVQDVFSIYNVQVTDVDPGTANHFEIMIAGNPTDIGQSNSVGGVSPIGCNAQGGYINNALVFDFANVWLPYPDPVEEMCATAAQELAHSFTLDHVTDASDPMTYYSYTGRKYFRDTNSQCGSDCVNGQAPFGGTCSGAGAQSHACLCTGFQTQNSVATIQGLFGAGPGTPPVITFTTPHNGDNVTPGFAIAPDVMENAPQGVQKVDILIDGTMAASLTRAPYVINSPMTLGDGNHKIEAQATDFQGTVGKGTINVYIGPPCEKPSDCAMETDTCIGGRCVPGPGVQGGLGSTCTNGPDCASGQCASDGSSMYCVEPCMKGQCPGGFGCEVESGQTMGVCWPGFDDGSGGCSVAPGGAVTSGLLFAALVFGRRRRRH
jgi:hypothetical protein